MVGPDNPGKPKGFFWLFGLCPICFLFHFFGLRLPPTRTPILIADRSTIPIQGMNSIETFALSQKMDNRLLCLRIETFTRIAKSTGITSCAISFGSNLYSFLVRICSRKNTIPGLRCSRPWSCSSCCYAGVESRWTFFS